MYFSHNGVLFFYYSIFIVMDVGVMHSFIIQFSQKHAHIYVLNSDRCAMHTRRGLMFCGRECR